MKKRFQVFLKHNVLGLDDTPHRIAWGVFLGCIVLFTPTIGFQIVLYVALATILRANKVSGVPILFVSNPITAIPLYYSVWRVGYHLLHGWATPAKEAERQLIQRLHAGQDAAAAGWQALLDLQFWKAVARVLIELGDELWVGALALGLIFGMPLYFLTLRAVQAFRDALERRASRVPPAHL